MFICTEKRKYHYHHHHYNIPDQHIWIFLPLGSQGKLHYPSFSKAAMQFQLSV